MQEKVRNFIKEYHMVEKGDCVLAAVSGGADSVCLLLLLQELSRELGITLRAVHVEHGIRGEESQRDAEFVEELCIQRKIPCVVFHCNVLQYAQQNRKSVEEGARELRYGYFQQAAEEFGAHKIAVAHHQNDCAETILFHLARGTGLKGLCGIPPVREQIIRPLLCLSRQEIESYLAAVKQTFCTDRTNQELLYSRNHIRHQVLPLLTQINAQAVSHMCRTAADAAEAAELLEDLACRGMEHYVTEQEGELCISERLLEERPVVQKAVIYKALIQAAGNSRDIARLHVEQIRELFARQCGRNLALPYGVEARRGYQEIGLKKRENNCQAPAQGRGWILPASGNLCISGYEYEIHTQLLDNLPQNEEIPKKMYTKWFDYDKIKGNMRMRTRQKQDFLVIDTQGNRKKLKRYFIDEKVPAKKREQILLLADDTHILWVVGYRISEDVKVTEHTKRILEIRINGGTAYE